MEHFLKSKGLKKITEALVAPEGKTAIFADKFGDVFSIGTFLYIIPSLDKK